MLKKLNYASGYLTKWLLLATIMGIGGGISAIILYSGISLISNKANILPLWLSPIVGGLIVCIIFLFDKDASGSGMNRYINSANTHSGYLKKRTFLTKIAATSVTLGFNGSGGLTGPMVIIGGALANVLGSLPFAKKIISMEDKRILTLCGAAGAIGAIFRSPLGGGIFVVEVLYRSSLHYTELFPAILSSTIGYSVFKMLTNSNQLFTISDYNPLSLHIPLFILAGIIASLASLLFMWVFDISVKKFKNFKSAVVITPVIGGALSGIIFLLVPKSSGVGTNVIQELISVSSISLLTLILLLLGKIFATSFTVGSGGSGGLVMPSLFIGAVCGKLAFYLLPFLDNSFSPALIIAGMSASLACIANVPVAAAIMIMEMFGVNLGVPSIIGSIIGYSIGHNKIIYDSTKSNTESFIASNVFRKIDRRKE